MEQKFKRDLKSLDKVFGYIRKFVGKNHLDNSIFFTLSLVVEELFTNMVKYNSKNTNDILINLNKENNKLIIMLTDFNVEPFDITKKKDINVNQHLDQRKVGGLGLHLVKQMVDKIEYEYKEGTSKIVLTKNLEQ